MQRGVGRAAPRGRAGDQAAKGMKASKGANEAHLKQSVGDRVKGGLADERPQLWVVHLQPAATLLRGVCVCARTPHPPAHPPPTQARASISHPPTHPPTQHAAAHLDHVAAQATGVYKPSLHAQLCKVLGPEGAAQALAQQHGVGPRLRGLVGAWVDALVDGVGSAHVHGRVEEGGVLGPPPSPSPRCAIPCPCGPPLPRHPSATHKARERTSQRTNSARLSAGQAAGGGWRRHHPLPTAPMKRRKKTGRGDKQCAPLRGGGDRRRHLKSTSPPQGPALGTPHAARLPCRARG